jgi:mono/diheme cytochrome c family protein
MRSQENYSPFVAIGLGLTLAIAAVLQLYLLREPARVEAARAAERAEAVEAGRELYADNCVACHGEKGEGKAGVGPALNSRELLKTTPDETLIGLTNTGVPGTLMPAWGQAHGGPFTDEQTLQLVAFMRAWEPTAPEIVAEDLTPDPVRGATIFAQTCFICHGENGQGTERGPKLNDPARLDDFEEPWYRSTIAYGRPAKGMPSWGTVLSQRQLDDVVALLMAWRDGEAVQASIPLSKRLASALFAVQQFDPRDAEYHLTAALEQATAPQAEDIQAVLNLIAAKDRGGAEARLIALLPPEEIGKELFAAHCASCHAADGTGGLGPSLRANQFIQSRDDAELVNAILKLFEEVNTAMEGFDGTITAEQLNYIVIVLRSWQE